MAVGGAPAQNASCRGLVRPETHGPTPLPLKATDARNTSRRHRACRVPTSQYSSSSQVSTWPRLPLPFLLPPLTPPLRRPPPPSTRPPQLMLQRPGGMAAGVAVAVTWSGTDTARTSVGQRPGSGTGARTAVAKGLTNPVGIAATGAAQAAELASLLLWLGVAAALPSLFATAAAAPAAAVAEV